MKWATWNDQLSLIVLLIIAILWIVGGIGWVKLPPEVSGATIVVFTLVAQFYFRKSPTEVDSKPPVE